MNGDQLVEALMINGYTEGNIPAVDTDGNVYAIKAGTVIDGIVCLEIELI